jgi:hypothetical protein
MYLIDTRFSAAHRSGMYDIASTEALLAPRDQVGKFIGIDLLSTRQCRRNVLDVRDTSEESHRRHRSSSTT